MTSTATNHEYRLVEVTRTPAEKRAGVKFAELGQRALDEGGASGWKLQQFIYRDNGNRFILIWTRERDSDMTPEEIAEAQARFGKPSERIEEEQGFKARNPGNDDSMFSSCERL